MIKLPVYIYMIIETILLVIKDEEKIIYRYLTIEINCKYIFRDYKEKIIEVYDGYDKEYLYTIYYDQNGNMKNTNKEKAL